MNARMEPSPWTAGAFWVYAEYVPKDSKLSKSEKPSQWILISSWGTKESAEEACQAFKRMS